MAADTDTLRRTPLHDRHVAAGARLVPFAGWEMPVQYPAGIRAEHTAVRERAGVFDVSHMGQIETRGPGAGALLQRLDSGRTGHVVAHEPLEQGAGAPAAVSIWPMWLTSNTGAGGGVLGAFPGGVLDGHLPAGEGDEARASGRVRSCNGVRLRVSVSAAVGRPDPSKGSRARTGPLRAPLRRSHGTRDVGLDSRSATGIT